MNMRRTRFLWGLLVTICLMGIATGSLFGQAATGAIVGQVVDSSGAAIPGAEVVVISEASGQEFRTVTSDVGSFRVPSLTPVTYEVRVSLPGFKTFVAKNVKVNVGEERHLLCKLEVGEISETVTVAAGVELVQASTTQITQTITKQQIEDLPLNGRNPLALITLQAGTAANGRTATAIAGNRTSFTNMTLDGINIQDNFIRSNATTFSPSNPTVGQVAEFSITTVAQNVNAGFGSNQVSMVTPSGTNDISGQVYWFHRNDALAANSFFNNMRGIPRANLIRNQFGASFSGPIVRDKLLLYANYEGLRIRQQTTDNQTILTPDARQGIFTYVDSTGALQKVNLLELKGVEMDPFIQGLMSRLPTQINNFDLGDSSAELLKNTAGYAYVQRNNTDRDQGTFRLDFILNEDHSFEGIYSVQDSLTDRPDIDNFFNEIPIVTSGNGDKLNQRFVTAWKWTVTPTLLNDLRFGANLAPVSFDTTETWPDGIKVAGLIFSSPLSDFEPQGRDTRTWSLLDNASWQKGAHSFQFGFQSQFIRIERRIQFDVVPTVSVGFNTVNEGTLNLTSSDFPTGISSSDLNTARALLATLVGIRNELTQEFNISRAGGPFEPIPSITNWEYDTYAFYFGDTWRIHPRWTFNWGLRYEYYPGLQESDGLSAQLMKQPNKTIRESLLDPDSVYDFFSGPVAKADKNNFAPHIGLAWDIFGDGRNVLRVGYSVAYVNDESVKAPINALNRFGVSTSLTARNLDGFISGSRNFLDPPEQRIPMTMREIHETLQPLPVGYSVDPDLVVPYVQTWYLSVQRELGWDTALELRYVGTKGTKLTRSIDLNQVLFPPGYFEDFLRARNNGFLAEAAGLGFDPRYNPDIAGSQPLPFFDQMPGGGFLAVGSVRGRIQRGEVGDLAYLYHTNEINIPYAWAPNPFNLVSDLYTNDGDSIYHSGQVELRRRFRDGLVFNWNYTFSKVLTNASATDQNNFAPYTDINNPGYDRGRAEFDTTHVMNANFIWELPFGRGRWINIENGVLDTILGGWEMTSIFQWQSGPPFHIISGRGTLNRAGRSARNTADSSLDNAGIRDLFGVGSDADGPYFISRNVVGPDGRAIATDGQTFDGQVFFHPEPGTLGSTPRWGFNGPNYFNWDLGVLKRFNLEPLTGQEDMNLEFRAEFFNVLNHNSFYIDVQDIDSANFGRLSSSNSAPRVIQFALKLNF
ncbi:MAG: hypothetical protein Kow00109_06330 [Acidobacteriota bacterium]